MKQGTVKFSKEFKTLTGNIWLGIENEYDMNSENPIEVFKRAEETIQQYAIASGLVVVFNSEGKLYPDPGWQPSVHQPVQVISVERTPEDTRISELVRDIYACTQLDGDNGLWSYSKLATTCEEAKLAYEVMGKKLRKKESDELLAKSAYINQKQQ